MAESGKRQHPLRDIRVKRQRIHGAGRVADNSKNQHGKTNTCRQIHPGMQEMRELLSQQSGVPERETTLSLPYVQPPFHHLSNVTTLFGQDAVRYIFKQRGGKVTPEELRKDIDLLIKQGIVAESMTHTLGRALNCMRKKYELQIRTDKQGHILYYELAA